MNKKFTLYPAIDLREGRVVRLEYGDPNRQTVFGNDPYEVGHRWMTQGAEWLHVVNLDGAFGEKGQANWQALAKLAMLPVKVQFGGGLRTAHDIERALAIGATRVILGTMAAENPAFITAAVQKYGPERIIIALDAKAGIVQTRGWQTAANISAHDLGHQMRECGIQTILHTDIGRDGVLTGVNWQASQALAQATGLSVIASGGVASIDDVRYCLSADGISGVILGRALYDGRLDLAESLKQLIVDK